MSFEGTTSPTSRETRRDGLGVDIYEVTIDTSFASPMG